LAITGASGNVSIDVRGNGITNNAGGGITVAQGASSSTAVSFENNDVSQNASSAVSGGGGMEFLTGFSLSGFSANLVHGNGGHQLEFDGAASWSLNPSAGACAPVANQVYCYATNFLGLFAASGATVDASGISWQHAPPASGVDYVAASGGKVEFTSGPPYCGAGLTSCP
jgi:hypothetical protein